MPAVPLHVQTLGGFTIRRGESAIVINDRSRKLCLLLARLLQTRDRPVPCGELTALLWDGQVPGTASLNTLKAILHRARSLLDQLGPGTGRELLLNREGCYQWNPKVPLTLDTEEFSSRLREGGRAKNLDRRIALWTSALELYQGDYLPSLSGCPWAAAQAETLRQSYLQTVQQLLPLLAGRERWQETARLAGAALLLDPCREELCCWRLEALLHLDRRSEAVQVYEQFHQRLLTQQGVLPSQGLRDLYQQARREEDPRSISPVILQEQLRETGQTGALLCEYDFFRAICRSVGRMAERTGASLHVALLSLSGGEQSVLARHSLDRAMNNLEEILSTRLRRGDAFSRCSASQFVLLLPQASFENSQMVCTRITRAFSRQYPHSPAVLQSSVLPLIPQRQS
ncbi:MAG: hypothetical protein HFF44_01695 [Lawsonibacter sp.]|nr:hypothetical protein [Lawsonibacter sp.]